MMRSLYSGVSGLRNHQTRMDVIGNNISNVNTVGYKTSRVVFQDIYSQTSQAASAATDVIGGTNPIQVGLGVTLSTIDVLHTASATQRTDNPLDLAIEGEGFLIMDIDGTDNYHYTRAGNLYIDNAGNLVNSNGYFVMGHANAFTYGTPTIDTTTGDVTYPDPTVVEGTTLSEISFTYTAPIATPVVPGTTPPTYTIADEELMYSNISIDTTGTIKGINHNNEEVVIGQLVLSVFSNNSGLEKAGSSLYRETANSGEPLYTTANENGAGIFNVGGLEMSNVDLASEFTDMIVTQRGFQANSRVITTSDTLLEELINLKR